MYCLSAVFICMTFRLPNVCVLLCLLAIQAYMVLKSVTLVCPACGEIKHMLMCRCIYSGSWDYTMRVWHRNNLQLAAVVPFDDWVFSLASRGGHVLAGLSSRFHVLDQCTLQPLKRLYHPVCYIAFLHGRHNVKAFVALQKCCTTVHFLVCTYTCCWSFHSCLPADDGQSVLRVQITLPIATSPTMPYATVPDVALF